MHNISSPQIFLAKPVRIKGSGQAGWIIGEVTTVFGEQLVVFEPVASDGSFDLCRVLHPDAVEPRESR